MRINPWGAAGRSLTRPRPREESGQPGAKIFFALIVILFTPIWGAAAAPSPGAEASQAASPQAASHQAASPLETEAVTGPVNFDQAVRLAVRRSPYFTKSSLEIEIKRLDEKDSKYDLIPPITFRTQYYVNQPSGTTNRPYSLSFTYANYNPIESYFTLQAKKLFTQVTILAHLKIIEDGILKLGRMFLEMDALQHAAARQEDLIDLSQKNLDYYQSRARSGAVTSLEVRVAAQELEGAKAEKERIAFSRRRLQDRIKALIGMKPEQTLDLDCKEARRQVIGGFDPLAATLEQARSHSHEIKIAALKKELQSYNITLAKARLLPSIFGGATTPDPLNAVQSRDMFVYIGLDMPVWDGFKRFRNITRQKTILRQLDLDTEENANELAGKWLEVQESVRVADIARKAAQAQEELARLRERQSEIRYHSGGEPLAVYLEGRRNLVEAQRNTFQRIMDYDLAVLGVRRLTGDLGATYVDASSSQQ